VLALFEAERAAVEAKIDAARAASAKDLAAKVEARRAARSAAAAAAAAALGERSEREVATERAKDARALALDAFDDGGGGADEGAGEGAVVRVL
jgi:hypothetical protein